MNHHTVANGGKKMLNLKYYLQIKILPLFYNIRNSGMFKNSTRVVVHLSTIIYRQNEFETLGV